MVSGNLNKWGDFKIYCRLVKNRLGKPKEFTEYLRSTCEYKTKLAEYEELMSSVLAIYQGKYDDDKTQFNPAQPFNEAPWLMLVRAGTDYVIRTFLRYIIKYKKKEKYNLNRQYIEFHRQRLPII